MPVALPSLHRVPRRQSVVARATNHSKSEVVRLAAASVLAAPLLAAAPAAFAGEPLFARGTDATSTGPGTKSPTSQLNDATDADKTPLIGGLAAGIAVVGAGLAAVTGGKVCMDLVMALWL